MFTIKDILSAITVKEFSGNESATVKQFINFDETNTYPEVMMWVNDKNLHRVKDLQQGTVICSSTDGFDRRPSVNYVIVETPRSAFREILEKFFVKKRPVGIHPTAYIHPTSTVGTDVFLGAGVVIEENCTVGDGTYIDHNTVIKNDTKIGSHVFIGANNTIGGVGFGYEKDLEGHYIQIPHLGNVVIEDHAEVGNNTCIDRAVMGSTRICKNAKIDNLVHIAHGVVVGPNSLVIAHAMVAGSTELGENVWVAPCAAVLNKLKVGDNSFIGMSAVVIRDVPEGDIMVGNPAKSIRKN